MPTHEIQRRFFGAELMASLNEMQGHNPHNPMGNFNNFFNNLREENKKMKRMKEAVDAYITEYVNNRTLSL